MNRSDLIENISEELHPLTPAEAKTLLESIFNELGNALADGKKVRLNNFLHLDTKTLNFRRRHNPKTGEEVYLTDRKVVTFKPGMAMKRALDPHQS